MRGILGTVTEKGKSQKFTALLTVLGLIAALIPMGIWAQSRAEGAPADTARPIIGGEGDPWPSDPPRPSGTEELKNAGSIALVFEFGSYYGYQTMGGAIPGTEWKPCPKNYPNMPESKKRFKDSGLCRNWDQNEALEKAIAPLKGSPLSIGIYHYARKQDEGGILGNNLPELKATSLADEAGYNKVIEKIRSLDASSPDHGREGGSFDTYYGANGEWGLGRLYRDMYLYRQQQLALHAGDPNFKPRPLYSKIILMSMADPHWHLTSTRPIGGSCKGNTRFTKNWRRWAFDHPEDGSFVDKYTDTDSEHGCLFWSDKLDANPGRAGMLDVARMIRGLGADIRVLGMGDWIYAVPVTGRGGSTRPMFLRALTGANPTEQTPNFQSIYFKSDNEKLPNNWFHYPNGEYYAHPQKDDIANGNFFRYLKNWVLEDSHISVTSDLVDQDFRYVKPNAGQDFRFTSVHGGISQDYATERDGRVVVNLTKAKMADGVEVRQEAEKENRYVFTKFKGHNARCRGLNRQTDKFEDFTPADLDADDGGRIGFRITPAEARKYFSIKCATYSRPMQKAQLIKKAEVANEQIRYEIGGYPHRENSAVSYGFKWRCTDPMAYDPEKYEFKGSDERKVNGLNVVAELNPIPLSDVAVPVGTKCTIDETLNLPPGYTLDKAHRLFTSDTDFTQANFGIDASRTEKKKDRGQSVSNKIVATVRLSDPNSSVGEISKLVSHTVYSSLRAAVKVSLKFTNSQNDPALAARIKDGSLPKKVPVYYNCRFMADPTRPPELPEKNDGAYPGFVGVDWVGVPTDGRTEYVLGQDKKGNPTWPVGTHCLLSTTPPNEHIHGPNQSIGQQVKLPGVVTKDSYESTVCASDATASVKPTQPKACRNNYFWVHSGGEQIIRITQDLQRLKGKIKVTKVLAGEAARQGIGAAFPFNLECKDHNTVIPIPGHVPDSKPLWVRSTAPTVVDSVPAGAVCTLREISGRSQLTNADVRVPDPIRIDPITDVTEEKQVRLVNTATYKPRSLQIRHSVAWGTPTPGDAVKGALAGKNNRISVACTVPGENPQAVRYADIKGSGNATITGIPQGSVCTVQSEPQGIDSLGVNYSSPSRKVTLNWNDSGTVDLTTAYTLPEAGKFYLRSNVKSRPEYRALRSLIPETVNATLKCEGSSETKTVPIKVREGGVTEIPTRGIASGAGCSLGAVLLPPDTEKKIEVRWSLSDNPGGAAAGAKVSANIKAPETGKSGAQPLFIWFKMKTVAANLNTDPTMWTSKNAAATAGAERIPVPGEWRAAALGIGGNADSQTKVPVDLTCVLGSGENKSEVTQLLQLSNGGAQSSVSVPAGWRCKAKALADALKVPGADMKEVRWNGVQTRAVSVAVSPDPAAGPGSGSGDEPEEGLGYTYEWTSDTAKNITLNRDYRMQLASFNVKKKVGGEGVTIISADRQFEVQWSCKLNGKKIGIPAPRKINRIANPAAGEVADAQATFGDDLRERLQKLQPAGSAEIGRFQQGEWNTVDALPAGAACTLTETPESANEKNTVWDHYWAIADGYRSREPESICESSSDKCRPADEGATVKSTVLLPRDIPARANRYYNAKRDNPIDRDGKPRNPVVPDMLPENFAGTMVTWNNYAFQKTQVRVSLKNTGNGAELVKGKTFKARLYCVPPPVAGRDGIAKPSSAAAITKVDFSFKETRPGVWEDVTGSQLIPVNYRCVLSEQKFPEFDAHVLTTIAKDSGQPTLTAGVDGLKNLFAYNGGRDSQTKDDSNLMLQDGEKQILGFVVHPDLVNNAREAQKQSVFQIENRFDRRAANLKVVQEVPKDSTDMYTSFGKALTANAAVGYRAYYRCTDKYLKDRNPADQSLKPRVYEGSMDLPADGGISLLSGAAGGNFVPATSECEIRHENLAGKDPLTAYPKLSLVPGSVLRIRGREDQSASAGKQTTPGVLNVKPLGLEETDENNAAVLTFRDLYFVPNVKYQIATAVDGPRRDDVLPAEHTYSYGYACTYPQDGLPVPPGSEYPGGKYPPLTGTLDPQERGKFATLPGMPIGTVCEITGTKPDTSRIRHLKVAANWVPWGQDLPDVPEPPDAPKAPDAPEQQPKKGYFSNINTKVTLTDSDFKVTLNDDTKRGAVLYSVYINGTKVRIYKTGKPHGRPVVEDAGFRMFVAGSGKHPFGNEIDLKPVSAGVFESQTELAPGSYLVTNTAAGKNAGEKFPFTWKFDIALEPPTGQKPEGDTAVKLSTETGSSGLVAAYAPTGEIPAWQIELADVTFGSLPKTGGYLPWVLLTGICLIGASAVTMWRRRRE